MRLPPLDVKLLSAGPSFVVFLWFSLFLRCILYFFSVSERYKQKHNSKSSNKGTWLLWLFICFPLISFLSLSPVLGRASYESFSDDDLV